MQDIIHPKFLKIIVEYSEEIPFDEQAAQVPGLQWGAQPNTHVYSGVQHAGALQAGT